MVGGDKFDDVDLDIFENRVSSFILEYLGYVFDNRKLTPEQRDKVQVIIDEITANDAKKSRFKLHLPYLECLRDVEYKDDDKIIDKYIECKKKKLY